MADMDFTEIKHTRSTDRDETIENLIGRLVDGSASKEDVAELQALSATSAQRMKPSPPCPPRLDYWRLRRKTA